MKTLRSYLSTKLQEEDTMKNFMQQMLAIEQSRVDIEATRLDKEASVRKKEKAQAAERRELDRQAMPDRQDRFKRLLEVVQGARARTTSPPPAPVCTFRNLLRNRQHVSIWICLKPLPMPVNGQ